MDRWSLGCEGGALCRLAPSGRVPSVALGFRAGGVVVAVWDPGGCDVACGDVTDGTAPVSRVFRVASIVSGPPGRCSHASCVSQVRRLLVNARRPAGGRRFLMAPGGAVGGGPPAVPPGSGARVAFLPGLVSRRLRPGSPPRLLGWGCGHRPPTNQPTISRSTTSVLLMIVFDLDPT